MPSKTPCFHEFFEQDSCPFNQDKRKCKFDHHITENMKNDPQLIAEMERIKSTRDTKKNNRYNNTTREWNGAIDQAQRNDSANRNAFGSPHEANRNAESSNIELARPPLPNAEYHEIHRPTDQMHEAQNQPTKNPATEGYYWPQPEKVPAQQLPVYNHHHQDPFLSEKRKIIQGQNHLIGQSIPWPPPAHPILWPQYNMQTRMPPNQLLSQAVH